MPVVWQSLLESHWPFQLSCSLLGMASRWHAGRLAAEGQGAARAPIMQPMQLPTCPVRWIREVSCGVSAGRSSNIERE